MNTFIEVSIYNQGNKHLSCVSPFTSTAAIGFMFHALIVWIVISSFYKITNIQTGITMLFDQNKKISQ